MQNATLLTCESGVTLACGAKEQIPGTNMTLEQVFRPSAPSQSQSHALSMGSSKHEELKYRAIMRKQHVYTPESVELLSHPQVRARDGDGASDANKTSLRPYFPLRRLDAPRSSRRRLIPAHSTRSLS